MTVSAEKVERTPTMGSELVFKTRVAFARQQFDSATFRCYDVTRRDGVVDDW